MWGLQKCVERPQTSMSCLGMSPQVQNGASTRQLKLLERQNLSTIPTDVKNGQAVVEVTNYTLPTVFIVVFNYYWYN